MNLASDRAAIFQCVSGARDFWEGLEHLPPVPMYGQKSGERTQAWANASLGDYLIVAEYLRTALWKLADEAVPKEMADPEQAFLLHCRYSGSSSVPRLIGAKKVREASAQTSLLIYQLWRTHEGPGTEPETGDLEQTQHQLGWMASEVLRYMLSGASGREKLVQLQRAVNSLSVEASWLYAQIAITNWPPSLGGEDGMRMLRTVFVAVQDVMTRPQYLALTDHETWETLSERIKTVGESYGPAVREKIIAAQAPSESRFVAVLDPTSALYAAAIGVVGPAFKGMREGGDDGKADPAIETYKRVRRSFRPPEMDRTSVHDQYTDFVVPREGDGLWPASVPEVEYLARELLMLRGMDGEALSTPQEIIAEVAGGWIWLSTPWSLPISLIDDENTQDWHRKAPLLAWMIHASTSPSADQNFCANHDIVVRWVQKAWASEVERKRHSEFWADMQSVAIPGAIGTGVGTAFVLWMFPQIPPAAAGAMNAMIYPLIKLIQKARN